MFEEVRIVTKRGRFGWSNACFRGRFSILNSRFLAGQDTLYTGSLSLLLFSPLTKPLGQLTTSLPTHSLLPFFAEKSSCGFYTASVNILFILLIFAATL